jgi:O-antigen/teichoic acid export membrane protein
VALATRLVLVQAAVLALVLGAARLAATPLAALLGVDNARHVFLSFCLLVGVCALSITLAVLRGLSKALMASVVLLVGMGVTPLASFLITNSLTGLLSLQSATLVVLSLVVLLVICRPVPPEPGPATVRPKTVLRYALRRVPGDAALPALLTMPTFLVARRSPGSASAGYVGFATSVVVLICAAFATLNMVMLPRLSGRAAEGTLDPVLWARLRALPLVVCGLAVVAAVPALLLAPALVRGYLGSDFGAAVPVMRLGVLAAPPLAVYYAARPTLDALQDRPSTVRILIVALLAEIACFFALDTFLVTSYAAMISFVAATVLLGVSAYVTLLRVDPAPRSAS